MVSMKIVKGVNARQDVRKMLQSDIKALKDRKAEIKDDLKYQKKYSAKWLTLREKRADLNKRIKKLEKILAPYMKPLEKESIYAKR
jgi:hypothetical protein